MSHTTDEYLRRPLNKHVGAKGFPAMMEAMFVYNMQSCERMIEYITELA